MSIVAFEPPVLTTETTCVALPTELANQGVAAPLTGASTRDPQIRHAAAHSETSSRRMDSIVRRRQPQGQVKLCNQLGHRAVINGTDGTGQGGPTAVHHSGHSESYWRHGRIRPQVVRHRRSPRGAARRG